MMLLISDKMAAVLLNHQIKLVLHLLVMNTLLRLQLFQALHCRVPVVRLLRLLDCLLVQLTLAVDEHVSAGGGTSKHLLKRAWKDRSHCAVIEVKPVLNKLFRRVSNREVAQIVIPSNVLLLLLLFLLLLLIVLAALLLLSLVLVLLSSVLLTLLFLLAVLAVGGIVNFDWLLDNLRLGLHFLFLCFAFSLFFLELLFKVSL